MAIGWLSVLKLVPWTDVVKNAPVVADGAKKLWSTVAKKPAAPDPVVMPEPASPSVDALSINALRTRLAAAEQATAGLQKQMLESTELIKALAEQNIQLVERVEVNRRRLRWVAAATVLTAVIAAISLTVTLMGGAG